MTNFFFEKKRERAKTQWDCSAEFVTYTKPGSLTSPLVPIITPTTIGPSVQYVRRLSALLNHQLESKHNSVLGPPPPSILSSPPSPWDTYPVITSESTATQIGVVEPIIWS